MKIPLAVAVLLLAGCQSVPPGTERGPDGSIVYRVPIESSEPGARIEINGESVGVAPMVVKIYGDKDGSFHSFGSYEFVVRAYPADGKGAPLTKIYKTGALFAAEDKVPDKIYFDFGANR